MIPTERRYREWIKTKGEKERNGAGVAEQPERITAEEIKGRLARALTMPRMHADKGRGESENKKNNEQTGEQIRTGKRLAPRYDVLLQPRYIVKSLTIQFRPAKHLDTYALYINVATILEVLVHILLLFFFYPGRRINEYSKHFSKY